MNNKVKTLQVKHDAEQYREAQMQKIFDMFVRKNGRHAETMEELGEFVLEEQRSGRLKPDQKIDPYGDSESW